MKCTRVILSIIILFFIFQTPNICYSQAGVIGRTVAKGVTKNAAKDAVKVTAKAATKGAVKATAKAATKSAVKTSVKTATKSAVEKGINATTKQTVKNEIAKSSTGIVKNEAKALTKKAIKQEVQKSLEKGSSKSAREATESVVKKEAQKTAKESLVSTSVVKTEKNALKNGEKAVVKQGVRSAPKSATTKTITKATVQDSKVIMNSAVKSEVKTVVMAKGAKVAQKATVKEISVNATTESVENALNKTAAKRWESLVKTDIHATDILLKDLESNPQLIKQFKQNPALLDVYHRNIGSSTYRIDINMLRYQSYGANKFSDELVFRNKITKKLERYTGDDLMIFEKNGMNYIKNIKTDKLLGSISGNAEGRVIIVYREGRELLNLYPLGNTTYIVDEGYSKIIYKTDKQGFVKECTSQFYADLPSGVGNLKRNKNKISRIRDIKNDYNSLGQRSSHNHNLADDGGHIVPKSMGGSDDAINIFPQNSKMNQSGIWKKSEREAKKAREKGKYVERTIYFSKENPSSLRPSSVHIVQKIEGKVTVNQTVINQKVFKKMQDSYFIQSLILSVC